MTTINITDDGFEIDDKALGELRIDHLTSVLGDPRIVPVREGTALWHYWDAAGVRADSIPGDPLVHALHLLKDAGEDGHQLWVADAAPHDSTAAAVFDGELLLNGIPFLEAVADQIEPGIMGVEAQIGATTVLGYLRTDSEGWEVDPTVEPSPWSVWFVQTRRLTEWVDSQREPAATEAHAQSAADYEVPTPTGELMSFSSLNWKLAVLQELMYHQELLSPQFDLREFASVTMADLDVDDHADRIVPQAQRWFENYPVPRELGASVEELELDGGNDIYLELIPFWSGESDDFDIASLTDEDLEQLPQLRHVDDLGRFLGDHARKVLLRHDIQVD